MTDLERHLANREELLAARAGFEKQWAAEDADTVARRASVVASFERGLADCDAVIVAAGGVVPVAEPVEVEADPGAGPGSEPVEPGAAVEPEHHDDERHEV